MNLIKRAWLYVTRQKMKSLILFLVLTIVATFVLTGVSIQSAAKDAAKDVRTSVGGTIKLSLDMSEKNYKSVYGDGQNSGYQYVGDKITDETLAALMEVPGVIDYNAETPSGLFGAAVDFKYLPTQLSNFNIGGTSEYGADSSMSVVLSSEKFSGFTSGKLKLKNGRHIVETDDHVIMISNELAEYNNMSVGDTLKLYSAENDKILELEIVGIFTGTEGSGEDALLPSDRAGNQGIVDFNTKSDAYGSAYDFFDSLDIYVEDPVSIQNAYDEIARLPEIKGKTFTLNINSEEYDTIANPLESLQSLVRTLIIVIAVVSIAVLTLLLTLWIRNRVKETGILMSVGIGKMKIIGQFAVEVVLIAILAFGLSYFTSSAIADQSSDFILAQVVDSENLNGNGATTGANGAITGDSFDKLSGEPQGSVDVPDLKVNISTEYLIWVYVIGIGIIICSVILASYSIIRLKPREILSKMS